MPRVPERLYELLATQATEGLAGPEQRELGELLARHPQVDPFEFEHVAALVSQSLMRPSPVGLPAALRRRVARDAAQYSGTAGRGKARRPTDSAAGTHRLPPATEGR